MQIGHEDATGTICVKNTGIELYSYKIRIPAWAVVHQEYKKKYIYIYIHTLRHGRLL